MVVDRLIGDEDGIQPEEVHRGESYRVRHVLMQG
jgi:hypothetical protein